MNNYLTKNTIEKIKQILETGNIILCDRVNLKVPYLNFFIPGNFKHAFLFLGNIKKLIEYHPVLKQKFSRFKDKDFLCIDVIDFKFKITSIDKVLIGRKNIVILKHKKFSKSIDAAINSLYLLDFKFEYSLINIDKSYCFDFVAKCYNYNNIIKQDYFFKNFNFILSKSFISEFDHLYISNSKTFILS